MKRTLTGAGVSAALLALCVAVPTAALAQSKTLVYCSEGSPENFNPQINTTGTTFDANQPLYDGLVNFERGTINIRPGLAERWEVSDDGLTYTFFLRKGVKFHSSATFKPTREFNADDVIFTFERQWKKDHPYHLVSGGGYDYFDGIGLPTLLEAIEKVDDYTVRFRIKRPEAPFMANMAMPFASIMSAEYGAQLLKAGTPEKIDQEPIGTGPFTLVRYQKDAQIRYRAFADYWGGKAPLDNLVFAITPDAAVRWAKLKAGECHVAPYPNPADLPIIKADPDINLMRKEGLNIGYVAFNTTRTPFTDNRVRRAIKMAVDRQAIVDNVYQGAGVLAKNPIPPTMGLYYNTEIQDVPYDPEGARKLLAEAGFPNGFETDLWAMPVQRPHNPNARRMAEMVQADLAKIGVKVTIVSYEWGEYRKRLQQGEHQMGILGWTGDNGDPDNFLHTLLGCAASVPGGSNIAKWCHQPYDDIVVKAKSIADPQERAKLYWEAQRIFKEENVWITMAHSVVYLPVRKEVVDMRQSPLGRHDFYGVSLK